MPRWEKGYRCHGYMLQDGKRLGCVGLTPPLPGVKARYIADIDSHPQVDSRSFSKLCSAKCYVEKMLRIYKEGE